MNVARALFWGGSRSTKPCIFLCKVAAAGDERYLLCAAGLESVVADCIGMAAGLLSCFVAMCVDTCRFATGCCETHRNGCMKVAWALFWGGSRSTKPSIFLCKVAAAGDERYLPCAAGAAGVVLVSPLCSATSGCSCVRSVKCGL